MMPQEEMRVSFRATSDTTRKESSSNHSEDQKENYSKELGSYMNQS